MSSRTVACMMTLYSNIQIIRHVEKKATAKPDFLNYLLACKFKWAEKGDSSEIRLTLEEKFVKCNM